MEMGWGTFLERAALARLPDWGGGGYGERDKRGRRPRDSSQTEILEKDLALHPNHPFWERLPSSRTALRH